MKKLALVLIAALACATAITQGGSQVRAKAPYEVLSFNISQSGGPGIAPTVDDVFQNTAGYTVVWSWTDTGHYTATFSDGPGSLNQFLTSKVSGTYLDKDSSNTISFTLIQESATTVELWVSDITDGIPTDGALDRTFMELRFYPSP